MMLKLLLPLKGVLRSSQMRSNAQVYFRDAHWWGGSYPGSSRSFSELLMGDPHCYN